MDYSHIDARLESSSVLNYDLFCKASTPFHFSALNFQFWVIFAHSSIKFCLKSCVSQLTSLEGCQRIKFRSTQISNEIHSIRVKQFSNKFDLVITYFLGSLSATLFFIIQINLVYECITYFEVIDTSTELWGYLLQCFNPK